MECSYQHKDSFTGIADIYFLSASTLSVELAKIATSFPLDLDTLEREFKGQTDEVLPLFIQGKKVYLVGLGDNPTSLRVLQVARHFFFKFHQKLNQSLQICYLGEQIEALATGIYLGQYRIGLYKTDTLAAAGFYANPALEFITEKEGDVAEKQMKRGFETAETQLDMLRLVDAPANHKTPDKLADWALASAEKYKYKATVLDAAACETLGLHALLAVGKGSVAHPPLFIVLEYGEKQANKPTIGLVGKGVTFDTGGVSLKPGDNMNYMKSDMGGAAAVLGTVELMAKRNVPIHLVAAIPVTENCIDSLAIKPGDVISSFSGKTIEVINTDAEGRLILADGLTYLNRTFQPDILIDLATLTGNCIMALGYAAAAMLTSNDELAASLTEFGMQTGEKVWRLPLWDEYAPMMDSDVADIKNLSSAPIAGAITAAKFLEIFTEKHPAWVHLDIAGVAFGDSPYGKMKSATAYGIRLLSAYIENKAGVL
jgi:leucyl aminopeptidase